MSAARKSSPAARVVLALAVLGFGLLAAAGAISMATGKPLRPALGALLGRGSGTASTTDNEGLYRVAADPLVSYVLRPGTDRPILGARVRSDELGLRARPGPPRGGDPLRVVVAGDSVAFGFGLEDEQTLAVRLEAELNAALGPEHRPVECRSVALPGWNHRNSVAAVLDHEDVLQPDLVVYVPIANDIFDTDAVDETGHRRVACDPSAADPWLIVNQTLAGHVELESARRLREAGRDDSWTTRGPQALSSDLSAESGRRYDENAASLLRLRQRMADRGGHFLLATFQDESYSQHLLRRFIEQHVPMDVVPLFTTLPEALKLPDDPHPNAEAVSAMARWIAADILRRGWLLEPAAAADATAGAAAPAPAPGSVRAAATAAASRVPPVPEAIEKVHAPLRPPLQTELASARTRRQQWQRLRPVIDVPGGEGCNQIYGGIRADGTAGPHALFLLPRPAKSLVVQLAPLEGRPDLYPQDVRVQIDGIDVGAVHLTGTGAATARFEVPPHAAATGDPSSPAGTDAPGEGASPQAKPGEGASPQAATPGGGSTPDAAAPLPPEGWPMEVRLIAERWGAVAQDQLSALVAFRPLRLEAAQD